MNKQIVLVDMDNVLCDFEKAYNDALEKTKGIQFPQSQYKFFENLEPIKGSLDAVKQLRKKYDVCILTRPSIRNPLCYTEKRNWIEKYFGLEFCNKLILSCDKTMIKGDFLIDDNIQRGRFEPEWRLLKFGSNEFPDWKSVLSELL